MTKKSVAYGLVAGLAAALTLAPSGAFAASTSDTEPAAVASASAGDSLPEQVDELLAKSDLPAELKDRIRSVAATLPADWKKTVTEKRSQYGFADTTYFERAQSVIDPGDYQCKRTALSEWLSTQLADVNLFHMLLLQILGGLQIPTYDALLFGEQDKSHEFGIDGSYTNELTSAMTNLKRFWAFDGSKIQLIPMHGSVYQDVDRITRVYETLYGFDHEQARSTAEVVHAVVMVDPALDDGENPYFTFNAFAFSPEDAPLAQELGVSKRIIMGDGILQGMRGIGLGDKAAPLGILAHEYGHHVQYARDLFESELTGAKATRRTELMADAFGSYYVVHARGEALNAQRTLDVAKSFYNVGDCGFSSVNHHGTPSQRFRSSKWAVSVVNSAPDQGHKHTGLEFNAKFEDKLPELVAPDAN